MNKSAIIGIVIVVVLLFGGLLLVKSRNNSSTMMKTQETTAKPTEAMMKPTDAMMGKGAVMMSKSSKFGDYVTAANDMTLYTFDKDSANVSNCSGQCATEWPPYFVTGAAPSPMPAHLGTFTNSDGKMQYTWDSKPLYFFAEDRKVGDTNGDGYSPLWHIAK